MIIHTAIDGRADIIVTGDSHLLSLETFNEINITTLEKMLATLERKETV